MRSGHGHGSRLTPPPGGMDLQTALQLLSAAGSLGTTVDLDFLLVKVGAAAESLLDSEASAILLATEDKASLYFKVASGAKSGALKTMTLRIGEGVGGWVAQNRKPKIVNDAKHDPLLARSFDRASGFVTRSLLCVPMVHRGELIGVIEVLNRRSGHYIAEHARLLGELAAFAASTIYQTKALADGRNFMSHTLELMALAIESTRPGMEGHAARSARLARSIGRALGVDEYTGRMLNFAGMLHDAGYLAMDSRELLTDMGILQPTEEEHPVLSAKLLEGITVLEGAIPMILHHHERFDGGGYPDRLKGDAIPLGARILGLVEAVEELRMHGLRGSELYEKALQETQAGAGRSFDPAVVDAFAEMIRRKTTAW